jgi:hypothetical protein
MTNVIEFNRALDFKVLFNLPNNKVVKIHKTAEDNFDIELKDGYGTAYISANAKSAAEQRIQRVFPGAEIIETTVL